MRCQTQPPAIALIKVDLEPRMPNNLRGAVDALTFSPVPPIIISFIIFIISSLDARLGTAVDFRGIWHDRSHPPTECLEVHASTLTQT